MKLSVVILNYNVRYFLELCLKSVEKALINIDSEIIVIDNNSSDDSCHMIEQLFLNVVLIKNSKNIGFSNANNQAVKSAKGEYICILNPDTVVAEDTFTKLLEFSESILDPGIVGCRLIDGTGKFLPESKRNIPIIKVAVQKMLGNDKQYYANHITEDDFGKVDVLVGAFMLIKKKVFDVVGGFDQDYFMYGEDIDLSYRLLKAGYNNYYFGKTTIIHYKGESTQKDKSYSRRFYGAMQVFYKKHFRSNLIYNMAVWLGLKIAFVLRRPPKNTKMEIKEYVLLSHTEHDDWQNVLPMDVRKTSTLNDIKGNSEIIFNANYLSYKDIIQHLIDLRIHKRLSFKILPNKSSFLIGSDDSINRGEIMHLKK